MRNYTRSMKFRLKLTISLRFLSIILRVLRLEISVYNVYIADHFCSGGGGGWVVNPLVYGTVNSKEKNSSDFCPKYVQEFGSWSGLVQRGLVGSALACCKAGPSSNLGSAPHGGSAH